MKRPGDPRGTNRWRLLRAQLVALASDCAICGYPLDKRALPRSRWSPSVDHIEPVYQRPDLAFDPANCRVVHFGCNSRKAAHVRNHGATPPAAPRTTPRRWEI